VGKSAGLSLLGDFGDIRQLPGLESLAPSLAVQLDGKVGMDRIWIAKRRNTGRNHAER
jgi:hypothetical protein